MSDRRFTPAQIGPQPDHTQNWLAPDVAPVASEAPLSHVEVARLAELRRMPAPITPPEKVELDALAAREHIPQPPLTDEEQKRLVALSEPRVLSDAERAELDALGRRADIPRPPAPGEPIHDFLGMLISEIEVLASRVSVAHDFGPRVARLKVALEALKTPPSK